MKSVLAVLLVCLVAVQAARLRREEKYTSQYDNVDLQEILNSDRLLKNYHDCIMDRGSCTPDGKLLKEVIPDALINECAKCTEKQKKEAETIIQFFAKNKPEIWEELKNKFDPDGKYHEHYAHFLKTISEDSHRM